ncbi:hypothetical protein QBC32DRAFT_391815 [Pseudoneurospora amorphoporcata]|uniref:Uncharacterized protein n=1 Tax=Pseudoneurospora amorphoporcata TaxID=241081 RepID=A0AAN6NXK2_9PEZI|nr:hypothetical protein QBC32DRAFT_391815 [Pseudoneurospora amorphoporcata]
MDARPCKRCSDTREMFPWDFSECVPESEKLRVWLLTGPAGLVGIAGIADIARFTGLAVPIILVLTNLLFGRAIIILLNFVVLYVLTNLLFGRAIIILILFVVLYVLTNLLFGRAVIILILFVTFILVVALILRPRNNVSDITQAHLPVLNAEFLGEQLENVEKVRFAVFAIVLPLMLDFKFDRVVLNILIMIRVPGEPQLTLSNIHFPFVDDIQLHKIGRKAGDQEIG